MPRSRRNATETRSACIEAARELLVAHGPAGVHLDAVAAAVGVSRQAVLHHFESREGLMRAVVAQAWLGLFADLAPALRSSQASPEAFVDRVDDVTRRQGNARLGAWLLLSGEGLPDAVFQGALGPVAPEEADRLLLVGAALFGDAIFGSRLRQALGVPDDEASRARFRQVLVDRAWSDPQDRGGSGA